MGEAQNVAPIALLLLIFCAGGAVYLRIAARLRAEGGRVEVSHFALPDVLVVFVLAGFFGALALSAALGDRAGATTVQPNHVIINAAFFAVLVGAVVVLLRARRLSVVNLFGLRRVSPGRALGWAGLLLVSVFPFVAVVNVTSAKLLGNQAVSQPMVEFFRAAAQRSDFPVLGSIAIAAVIIAPLCEEFFFRGYFYGVGKRYFGSWISGLLTALLFAAIHANLASLPGLFLLALALTAAYERTGSLLVPAAMHALFNASNLAILYAYGSGWLQA